MNFDDLTPGQINYYLSMLVGGNYKTRSKTERIQETILDIFGELKPQLTVRQIYYALTVRHAVPKTEAGYRQTCYHLKTMRKDGIIPYGWIADNTRWVRKPTTYTGLGAALERWHQAYRRDLWANQSDYIEIWIEKDALAGVISPITSEYDVPLYVARGYGSMTFIYEAAEDIKNNGKQTWIYHFGDYDPSGVNAAENIQEGLESHGARVYFERVAILPYMIEGYHLPTRETKKKDPRAKNWQGESCELDALPAPILRDLVRDCIERHINHDELEKVKQAEKLEIETLNTIQKNFVPIQNSKAAP